MTWLTVVLMTVAASSLRAQTARIVPVNIFGDGNPLNGVEDSREPVTGTESNGRGSHDQQMNAGTITCDGKFRGTAMVVDTREFAPDLEGVVLVSAAHVLFNLDKNKLFRRCKFYFMGWDKIAGYRSKIDLKKIRMGNFDPRLSNGGSEVARGDWVFLYLRKPWRNFNPDQSIGIREFSFSQPGSYRQSGGEFRLLAFDSSAGVISESRNCIVVESHGNDLGGGTWKGQLLDDCDSADGASGGGIIAVLNQQHFLIGVRNGSHWDEQVYPADRFPSGPPDGSAWDRRTNTNFGRAIDKTLLEELNLLIQSLE
ncbi:MAG: hypothetical protein QNK24_02945 [Desulfuromusa sp.]|nr:hypothetical protein [Desulfuromusa sp.]